MRTTTRARQPGTALLVLLATSCPSLSVTPTPTPAPLATAAFPSSLYAFISDLHFGLGKLSSGEWNPLDDFRWSNALKGFLDEISRRSGANTTLVVAGDMLEMWQHPSISCTSGDAERGCTVAEMASLADLIIAAHRSDFEQLGRFAGQGENRLVIIPGNHDAALLLPTVRNRVAEAFQAPPGRVTIVESGVWASPDGRVVAEHGHQMPGEGVNSWETWPTITRRIQQRDFLLRPWGELFVQRLYDRVEGENSLIDNLIPQSNGVQHYLKQRGFEGSARDIARFFAFNIFEASPAQRIILGPPSTDQPTGPPVWDVRHAREKGWQLFAAAHPDSQVRAKLEDTSDNEWNGVRRELDALARDPEALSDDEVRNLCDKSIARERPGICRDSQTLAIGVIAGAIPGARDRSIRSHLTRRKREFSSMQVFVYGHTHTLQCPTAVTPTGGVSIAVANTGAFQRLIDDRKFQEVARQKQMTAAEALRGLTLDDLPPCYSAVLLTYLSGQPNPQVKNWYMAEGDAQGLFVEPGDCRCAKLGSQCGATAACP